MIERSWLHNNVPRQNQSVDDRHGHYDIDGVSYDNHTGVVVASDNTDRKKWWSRWILRLKKWRNSFLRLFGFYHFR